MVGWKPKCQTRNPGEGAGPSVWAKKQAPLAPAGTRSTWHDSDAVSPAVGTSTPLGVNNTPLLLAQCAIHVSVGIAQETVGFVGAAAPLGHHQRPFDRPVCLVENR